MGEDIDDGEDVSRSRQRVTTDIEPKMTWRDCGVEVGKEAMAVGGGVPDGKRKVLVIDDAFGSYTRMDDNVVKRTIW